MKIELYEQLKASLAAHAAKRQEDSAKRAAATADVANAKKQYDDLLEQAAAGGASDELNAAISRAHGAVLVAEKRKQLLEAQLGDPNQSPKLPRITLQGVMAEIRNQVNDGRLLDEFQPALDELATIRARYLDKLAEVLHIRARVNQELRDIQYDTRSMLELLTGESSSFGVMGHEQLILDDLRKYVWLHGDLAEETNRLQREVDETVNGQKREYGLQVRDKTVIPETRPANAVHYQTQVIGSVQ